MFIAELFRIVFFLAAMGLVLYGIGISGRRVPR